MSSSLKGRDPPMKKEKDEKENRDYLPYDDDRFYETGSAASAQDMTGLVPAPPLSEPEAEAYSDLYNVPLPQSEERDGTRRIRPKRPKRK